MKHPFTTPSAPPTSNYLVVSLQSGSFWTFDTPADVATFMWGRDFEEYSVYRLFPWTDGDLAKFRAALEGA